MNQACINLVLVSEILSLFADNRRRGNDRGGYRGGYGGNRGGYNNDRGGYNGDRGGYGNRPQSARGNLRIESLKLVSGWSSRR